MTAAAPIVNSADPTVAYTEDELWTVTIDDGPSCFAWDEPGARCGLPLHHGGDCVWISAELYGQGIRLHPVARLP